MQAIKNLVKHHGLRLRVYEGDNKGRIAHRVVATLTTLKIQYQHQSDAQETTIFYRIFIDVSLLEC